MMLADFSAYEWGALAFAVLLASYVRGYTGFGFSAIVMGIAALFTNPVPLIAIVLSCEVLLSAMQFKTVYKDVDWKRLRTLLLGAVLVMPVSIWSLGALPSEALRLFVFSIIIFMSLGLVLGLRVSFQPTPKSDFGVGLLSGACNAVGIGGAPVAIYLNATALPPVAFRALMVMYFAALDGIALPALGLSGYITIETIYAILMALPVLAFGLWLGGRQFHGVPADVFKRHTIIVLLGISVVGAIHVLF